MIKKLTRLMLPKYTLLLLMSTFLFGCNQKLKTAASIVPRIEMTDVSKHGIKLSDPYQWMEEPENRGELNEWLLAEGKITRQKLAEHPLRKHLLNRTKELVGESAIVYGMQTQGGRLFYYRRDVGANQPNLYYRDKLGVDRILLDMKALSDADGKSWSISGFKPSSDGKFLAYLITDSGDEVSSIQFLEVATGRKLPDEINNIWGEFTPTWLPDNSGVFYTQMSPESLINNTLDPVQDMQVYLHRMGDDVTNDIHVLGSQADNGLAFEGREFPGIIAVTESNYVIGYAAGARQEIRLFVSTLPDVLDQKKQHWKTLAEYDDSLTIGSILNDKIYILNYKDKPNGEVIAVPLNKPKLAAAEVIMPHSEQVIERVIAAKDGLYIKVMASGYHSLYHLGLDSQLPVQVKLPFKSNMRFTASTDKAGVYLRLVSWTKNSEYYYYNSADYIMKELTFGLPKDNEYDDFMATYIEVPSSHGVRVPMTIIHHKDLDKQANSPTILYGYGGYGYTMMPNSSPSLPAWLEQGGIMVYVNVRGGGAKGRQWYLDGKGKNKQNGIDDFNAAAEYLIQNRYSSPDTLIAQGGSMGGVLVSNAVTQRPELYAGALIDVAIINSTRFNLGINGENQIAELGDPQNKTDFESLLKIDAYQNLKPEISYPGMMFSFGLNDNRVSPWHTGKFAAKLKSYKSQNNPFYLRVSTSDGHGVGVSIDSMIEQRVDQWIFALMMADKNSD